MRADVCEIFEAIETVLGTEKIQELFEVVLTDNGAEFKNHPCWNETFPVNAVRTYFTATPWPHGKREDLKGIMNLFAIFSRKAALSPL